jgi:hypothetical protein
MKVSISISMQTNEVAGSCTNIFDSRKNGGNGAADVIYKAKSPIGTVLRNVQRLLITVVGWEIGRWI